MHKLGTTCVQAVCLAVESHVRRALANIAMCTKQGLCAVYTKVKTSPMHSRGGNFNTVNGLLVHIIHSPYKSPNILNRLLIINKHSGELL